MAMPGPTAGQTAPLALGGQRPTVAPLGGGVLCLTTPGDPGAPPRGLGEWLDAGAPPSRPLLAAPGRAPLGWGSAADLVDGLAQAFIDHGLDETRPVAAIGAFGPETGALALAAWRVGIPVAPIDAEALAALDDAALDRLAASLRPGLAYARAPGAGRLARRLIGADRDGVAYAGPGDFDRLAATPAGAEVDARARAVHPDRIAVIAAAPSPDRPARLHAFTHRAIALGAGALGALWPFLTRRAPVLGCLGPPRPGQGPLFLALALAHGGTLLGGLEAETAPDPRPSLLVGTADALARALACWRANARLADAVLADLDAIVVLDALPGGAVAEMLAALSLARRGDVPALLALAGPGEAAGAAFAMARPDAQPGACGIPRPGLTARLTPGAGGRHAVALAGPGLSAGQWAGGAVVAPPRDPDGFVETDWRAALAAPDDPTAGLALI